ncbi:L10-interacting MYB domain-containing protein, partial [Bienertia sinuspersici]
SPQQQQKRAKATWEDETTMIFCEICAEENNEALKFRQRSRKTYDQKLLKYEREKLKSEYTTWKNLIEKEIELGWGHDKNTIVNVNVVKLHDGGMKNLTELEIISSNICASATMSWNPYT